MNFEIGDKVVTEDGTLAEVITNTYTDKTAQFCVLRYELGHTGFYNIRWLTPAPKFKRYAPVYVCGDGEAHVGDWAENKIPGSMIGFLTFENGIHGWEAE